MPPVDPPLEHAVALREIASLTVGQFEELLNTIEANQSRSGVKNILDIINQYFSPEVAGDLLPAVRSILAYAEANQIDLIEFIAHVSDSSVVALSDQRREVFKDRLAALIVNGPLQVLHKSLVLALEQDRVLYETKITTDIRPVFGEQLDSGPCSALILHSLRITFKQDGFEKVEYFAMEEADLMLLNYAVQRALAKSSALRQWLASTDVNHIELGE